MKWSKRRRQLIALRAKYPGRYGPPLPDLKCDKPGLSPTSDRFDAIHDYSRPEPYQPPAGLVVDHLHKSSLQVLLRSELPWAGGKKP